MLTPSILWHRGVKEEVNICIQEAETGVSSLRSNSNSLLWSRPCSSGWPWWGRRPRWTRRSWIWTGWPPSPEPGRHPSSRPGGRRPWPRPRVHLRDGQGIRIKARSIFNVWKEVGWWGFHLFASLPPESSALPCTRWGWWQPRRRSLPQNENSGKKETSRAEKSFSWLNR